MTKLSILSAMACATLLCACGEGYEAVRVSSFPYGNDRTAGTGVAYVLKKMAPQKPLKIEPYPDMPAAQEVFKPVADPVVVPDVMHKDGASEDLKLKEIEGAFEKMFKKEQQK